MEVLDNLNILLTTFANWYFWLSIFYFLFYIIMTFVKFNYNLKMWNRNKLLNPNNTEKLPKLDLSVIITMKSILWFSLWIACSQL